MTVPFAVPLWLRLRYALSSTPEQLALNFFFTNHVLVPRHHEAPSDLIPVLASPYTQLLNLFLKARVRYGEALGYLKADLRDGVAIRRNETLMSVLVLGIVEVREQIPIIHISKLVSVTQKRDD